MEQFLLQNKELIFLILLWTLPWKGIALWQSARDNDKSWFIPLLIFNTLGVLEILYIFFLRKKERRIEA